MDGNSDLTQEKQFFLSTFVLFTMQSLEMFVEGKSDERDQTSKECLILACLCFQILLVVS